MVDNLEMYNVALPAFIWLNARLFVLFWQLVCVCVCGVGVCACVRVCVCACVACIVKPVLGDHPFCTAKPVAQDRWSLIAGCAK